LFSLCLVYDDVLMETYSVIKMGFGFHRAWYCLVLSPLPLASQPSGPLFIGIHITGLHPLGVTPAHSSSFIEISGSLLWGNPPHPGPSRQTPLGSPRYTRIPRQLPVEETSTTLMKNKAVSRRLSTLLGNNTQEIILSTHYYLR
jgi:hypothetical protein